MYESCQRGRKQQSIAHLSDGDRQTRVLRLRSSFHRQYSVRLDSACRRNVRKMREFDFRFVRRRHDARYDRRERLYRLHFAYARGASLHPFVKGRSGYGRIGEEPVRRVLVLVRIRFQRNARKRSFRAGRYRVSSVVFAERNGLFGRSVRVRVPDGEIHGGIRRANVRYDGGKRKTGFDRDRQIRVLRFDHSRPYVLAERASGGTGRHGDVEDRRLRLCRKQRFARKRIVTRI